MNRSEFLKFLKDSTETLEICTTHEDNWCPTCEESAKSIMQFSEIFHDSQVEKGKPIKEAYERSKSKGKL